MRAANQAKRAKEKRGPHHFQRLFLQLLWYYYEGYVPFIQDVFQCKSDVVEIGIWRKNFRLFQLQMESPILAAAVEFCVP